MLLCGVQVMLGSGAAPRQPAPVKAPGRSALLFSLPGFVPRRSSPGSSGTGTPKARREALPANGLTASDLAQVTAHQPA